MSIQSNIECLIVWALPSHKLAQADALHTVSILLQVVQLD